MGEENFKKDTWIGGRARNMESNSLSGIEGDNKDLDILVDIKRLTRMEWTCSKNESRKDSYENI